MARRAAARLYLRARDLEDFGQIALGRVDRVFFRHVANAKIAVAHVENLQSARLVATKIDKKLHLSDRGLDVCSFALLK